MPLNRKLLEKKADCIASPIKIPVDTNKGQMNINIINNNIISSSRGSISPSRMSLNVNVNRLELTNKNHFNFEESKEKNETIAEVLHNAQTFNLEKNLQQDGQLIYNHLKETNKKIFEEDNIIVEDSKSMLEQTNTNINMISQIHTEVHLPKAPKKQPIIHNYPLEISNCFDDEESSSHVRPDDTNINSSKMK